MKIAILSRNSNLYSTKRLVEAGEKLGHEMHVIDHLKCDLVIEKKNPTIVYKNQRLQGFDAILMQFRLQKNATRLRRMYV